MMQFRLLSAIALVTMMGVVACQKSDDGNKGAGGGTTGNKPAAAPPQDPKELAEPLATIDGYTITIGEFQERINKQSPYVRARYTSLEQKKDFLDNLVR